MPFYFRIETNCQEKIIICQGNVKELGTKSKAVTHYQKTFSLWTLTHSVHFKHFLLLLSFGMIETCLLKHTILCHSKKILGMEELSAASPVRCDSACRFNSSQIKLCTKCSFWFSLNKIAKKKICYSIKFIILQIYKHLQIHGKLLF